jgi:hypothetical protein
VHHVGARDSWGPCHGLGKNMSSISRYNLLTLVYGLKLNSGGQIYLLKEEYMVYYGFSMLTTSQRPLLHLPQMCGCMATIKMVWSYVSTISYTCHLCNLGILWESENIFCFVFCFNFNDFTFEKVTKNSSPILTYEHWYKRPQIGQMGMESRVNWPSPWSEPLHQSTRDEFT